MEHHLHLSPGAHARAETVGTHEHDPHGTPANAPGAKLDAGKLRAGLVLGDFAHALEQVSQVGTFGARKYTAHGWLSVPQGVQRYTDAMLRHWLAEHTGAPVDGQTGLLHAAHLAWNALARLELMLREAAIDGAPVSKSRIAFEEFI